MCWVGFVGEVGEPGFTLFIAFKILGLPHSCWRLSFQVLAFSVVQGAQTE